MSVLDNAAWYSLNAHHAPLAESLGRARRFPPDVSPFAAVEDLDEPAWADLAALAGPGRLVAMLRAEIPTPPAGWVEVFRTSAHQMVMSHTAPRGTSDARPLTPEDVPAMLELVKLTRPGPFGPRTAELGGYVGIEEDGRLVAMAGERLHPPGFSEVSAVCTHPDVRGRGLAAALTTHVATAITARGDVPFLHVEIANDTARRVYERIGFRTRRIVAGAAFTTPAPTPS